MICASGKLGYDSAAQARKALDATYARQGAAKTKPRRNGIKPSIYKCPACDAWHWGHRSAVERAPSARKAARFQRPKCERARD